MASVIRGSDNFDSLVHQGIGVNQTWQDMSASRSAGVTYTNTTGKPICVRLNLAYLSTNNSGVTIDGFSIDTRINTSGISNITDSFIVPNGSTYSVGYSYQLRGWYELR